MTNASSRPSANSHEPLKERSARSNSTRYICAAGYLDPQFCETVIDETLSQRHRAVAPSYDVDLTPILHHLLAARRERMWRDATISVVLLLLLFLFPLTLALPIILLHVVYLALSSALRRGELVRALPKGRSATIVGGILAIIVLWWLGSALTSQLSSRAYQYDPYTGMSQEPSLPGFGGAPLWLGLLLLLTLWGLLWYYRVATHQRIVEEFQPAAFRGAALPAIPAQLSPRIDYLEAAQRGNLTVYSETAVYQPFVGSGKVFDAWSVAIPLRPDENNAQAVDVAPHELSRQVLHDRLRLAFVSLNRPGASASDRLHNLSVQDRIYLAGRLAPDSPFLNQATLTPHHHLDGRVVQATSDEPRGATRHYQVVRVSSWEAELETSIFVYANIRGGMFYLEVVGTEVGPIRSRYHAIDGYERLSSRVVARLAGEALKEVIRDAPMSPIRLLRALSHSWRMQQQEREERRAVADRLSYDYGCRVSVRELASRQDLGYFEYSDIQEIFKIVSRRLVGALGEIFREFGFDRSEFEARANVVINNSTSITGSVVNQSSFATGNSASARSQQSSPGNPKL